MPDSEELWVVRHVCCGAINSCLLWICVPDREELWVVMHVRCGAIN